MPKCKWCERTYHYVAQFEELCDTCHRKYVERRDFECDVNGMPADDATEEEIWALCYPRTHEAEAIIDARIKRVTKQIQNTWSEEQRISRSVQKKRTRRVSRNQVNWARAKRKWSGGSNTLVTSGFLE
jgi:hypothetical protein